MTHNQTVRRGRPLAERPTTPPKTRPRPRGALVLLPVLVLASSDVGCRPRAAKPSDFELHRDRAGRLDGWTNAVGQSARAELDAERRLVALRTGDGKIAASYDEAGHLRELRSPSGKMSFGYDAFDRPIQTSYAFSPEKREEYEYDPLGRLARRVLHDAADRTFEIAYEYDLEGHLTAISDAEARITFVFDEVRREMTRTYPNGVTSRFAYSPQGDLVSLEHRDREAHVIVRYSYERDDAGRLSLIREEEAGRTHETRVTWGERGRLAGVTLPDKTTVRYTYDPAGRVTTREGAAGAVRFEYDAFGRATRAGGTAYRYDDAGRLRETVEGDRKTQIEWTTLGQVREVRQDGGVTRFVRDAFGNVASQAREKAARHYFPDVASSTPRSIAELDRDGRVTRFALASDTLMSVNDVSQGRRFFLEDGAGATRHVLDAGGLVLSHREPPLYHEAFERSLSGRGDVYWRRANEAVVRSTAIPAPDGDDYQRNEDYWTRGEYETADPYYSVFMRNNTDEAIRDDLSADMAHVSAWLGLGVKLLSLEAGPIGGLLYACFDGVLSGQRASLLDSITDSERRRRAVERVEAPEKIGLVVDVVQATKDVLGVRRKIVERVKSSEDVNKLELRTAGIDAERARYVTKPAFEYLGRWLREEWARGVAEQLVRGLTHGASLPSVEHERAQRRPNFWETLFPSARLAFEPKIEPPPKHTKPLTLTPPPLGPPRDWPPGGASHSGHDGGGPPGNPFAPGGSAYDVVRSIKRDLGGVEVGSEVRLFGQLGHVTGLVFDDQSGNFILLGDGDDRLDVPLVGLSDVALADLLVRKGYTKVWFSLDPADPKNPRGAWLKGVWGPSEYLPGTPAGDAMFEADWLMKQYSLGLDLQPDGRALPRHSRVTDLEDVLSLSLRRPGSGQPSWNRFWIVMGDVSVRRAGHSLLIEKQSTRVMTERMYEARGGLQSSKGQVDPIADAFAASFERNYDALALESPALARLKEWGKTFALVRWLHENGVSIRTDPKWIRTAPYKARVPALSAQRSNAERTAIVHVFGGDVVEPRCVVEGEDGSATGTVAEVLTAVRARPSASPFVELGVGRHRAGLVLPIGGDGSALWDREDTENIKRGGVTYRMKKGVAVSSEDGAGARIEYLREPSGALSGFKAKARSGWQGEASSSTSGSTFTASRPGGPRVSYRWDELGGLAGVTIDGRDHAHVRYDPAAGRAEIHLSGYDAVLGYAPAGELEEVSITPGPTTRGGTRGAARFSGSGRLGAAAGEAAERGARGQR